MFDEKELEQMDWEDLLWLAYKVLDITNEKHGVATIEYAMQKIRDVVEN